MDIVIVWCHYEIELNIYHQNVILFRWLKVFSMQSIHFYWIEFNESNSFRLFSFNYTTHEFNETKRHFIVIVRICSVYVLDCWLVNIQLYVYISTHSLTQLIYFPVCVYPLSHVFRLKCQFVCGVSNQHKHTRYYFHCEL